MHVEDSLQSSVREYISIPKDYQEFSALQSSDIAPTPMSMNSGKVEIVVSEQADLTNAAKVALALARKRR